MNKKGEATLAIMIAAIIGTVASTGALFAVGGGSAVASSGFTAVATGMSLYSQMPHVVRDFREKKAEEMGFINAKSMSDNDLLDAIRDDHVPQQTLNYGYVYINPNSSTELALNEE
jgi:formiminotetrahydrofolate cyclodeaminase